MDKIATMKDVVEAIAEKLIEIYGNMTASAEDAGEDAGESKKHAEYQIERAKTIQALCKENYAENKTAIKAILQQIVDAEPIE